MTPHEGPSDTLPEHPARLESGPGAAPGRSGVPRCSAGRRPELGFPLLISAPAGIMGMYTDWGNLKVVSCVAWLNGPDPAAQRCPMEWARWGRPFLVLALLGGWAAGRMEPCAGLRGAAVQAPT